MSKSITGEVRVAIPGGDVLLVPFEIPLSEALALSPREVAERYTTPATFAVVARFREVYGRVALASDVEAVAAIDEKG